MATAGSDTSDRGRWTAAAQPDRPAQTPRLVADRWRGGAFTLIELLVVVAIIALLISLLMPSLNKARQQGRAAVCRSNQHQLAIALQYYCNDFQDQLPYHSSNRRTADYGYESNKSTWAYRIGKIDKKKSIGSKWPGVDAIWHYGYIPWKHDNYDKDDVFKCPEADVQVKPPSRSATQWMCHYAMNSRLVGGHEDDPPYRKYCYKITDVKRPADVVMLSDAHCWIGNNGFYFGATFDQTYLPWPIMLLPNPYNLPNFTVDWAGHPGKATITAYVDGHVTAVREITKDDLIWN